jgi:WD40 repeat protein
MPTEQIATPWRPWDEIKRSWSVVALTAWLVGVCALSAVGWTRHRSFIGRLRNLHPGQDEWQAQWRQMCDEQGIRAPIALLMSDATGPALCWTWGGYRLVVPEALWTGLSPSERSAILRHELEHYRRGDLWTTLLARGLAVLHWFNPLAWRAVGRFEAQTEFLCDRAAAADDSSALASMLLRLGSRPRERMAIVHSAGNGSLFERIQRLLADAPQPARWKCALPIVVSMVALGIMAVRLRTVGATDLDSEPPVGAVVAKDTPSPLPPRALLRIGTEKLRTRGNIRSFAISPGGRLVAAGDLYVPDPRVTIFDMQTGRRVKQLVAPEDEVSWVDEVAFSPDGTKLLWGELGKFVALWDLSTDRLLFREKLHETNVMDVKFSPDGRLFASGGSDGVVRVRRVDQPEDGARDFHLPPVAKDNLRREAVAHLAFTPDGTRLVVGAMSKDAMIYVWRLSDGRLLGRFGPATGAVLKSMAVTPDSRQVLSAGSRWVPAKNTKAQAAQPEVKRDNVTAPPPPGLQLADVPQVGRAEIRLWDIETGERLRELNGADELGYGDVALSPDGRRMAAVNLSGLSMREIATGKPEWTISLPGWWGRPTAFSSDGRLLVLPEQNALAIFDAATGQRLHHDDSTPVGDFGASPSWSSGAAAWSASGDRIVTGHSDGFVRVWNAVTGKLIWHKRLAPIVEYGGMAARPSFVEFSRDGKHVVAAGIRDDPAKTGKGIVVIYEAESGQIVREVIPGNEFRRVALAPDGRMVVVAYDNLLRGIEVATGRIPWKTRTVSQPDKFVEVAALQFESDPTWLQAALKDGRVIRFNALTGQEQQRFLADEGCLTGSFSADGRTMALSFDGRIGVWDVAAGTLRQRIPYPHASGAVLAVAPDGKTFAASDVPDDDDFGDDMIRLYDVETGKLVRTLNPGDDRARVLAFSPDGTKLLSGFNGGSLIVWDVRREQ